MKSWSEQIQFHTKTKKATALFKTFNEIGNVYKATLQFHTNSSQCIAIQSSLKSDNIKNFAVLFVCFQVHTNAIISKPGPCAVNSHFQQTES